MAEDDKYDWEQFDVELRELLSRYAPVAGQVNTWSDEGIGDYDDSDKGLQPPFVVGDFILAAVFEDQAGETYTAYMAPQGAVAYRIKGLVQGLRERHHDV